MNMTLTSTSVLFLSLLSYCGALLLDTNCVVDPPCLCVRDRIECSGRSLPDVPNIQPLNWTRSFLTLSFGQNRITSIGQSDFINITTSDSTYIELQLQENLISRLDATCFNTIGNSLYSINLTDNRLQTLSSAFTNLTKLQKLYLDRNPISTLDPFTMNELGRSLDTLEIDMSLFKEWPTELHFLRQLTSLSVYGIPFLNIHTDAFRGFENSLQSLAIFRSNLEELPVALCHLTNINRFDFEDNHNLIIDEIHTEKCHVDTLNLARQIRLTFRNNSLVRFPHILHDGSSFRKVDMGNNGIQYIEEGIIAKCGVTDFLLDHNKLTRVPYALNNLEFVSSIDLSFNEITSLQDPDLVNLKQLASLNLANNKIKFISKNAFINNAYLYKLDLSNNKLNTIPEALTQASGLYALHLDGNTIDCTCLDFDRKVWDTSKVALTGFCEFGIETLQSFLSTVYSICL